MDSSAVLSGMLVVVMLVAVGGMMWNRIKKDGGITWEIMRFTTVCIALPLVGVLALSGKLDQASTAIIAGALGYVFGRPDGNQEIEGQETPKVQAEESAPPVPSRAPS
ncbi:MAG TPA: hypothetical protein VEW71_00800 [Allosphingosinicella sp.]|nr:hypothetical protein [Allosphingosinicella sp.]